MSNFQQNINSNNDENFVYYVVHSFWPDKAAQANLDKLIPLEAIEHCGKYKKNVYKFYGDNWEKWPATRDHKRYICARNSDIAIAITEKSNSELKEAKKKRIEDSYYYLTKLYRPHPKEIRWMVDAKSYYNQKPVYPLDSHKTGFSSISFIIAAKNALNKCKEDMDFNGGKPNGCLVSAIQTHGKIRRYIELGVFDRSITLFEETLDSKDKIKKTAKDEKPKNESEEISGASGTAFFIDNNGHMITNHHVIEGCKDKSQISYNNENIKAKLIAKDEFLDLALLKADVKNSNFINISSAPPKKLKRIIVAGYPFGLELSNDLKFNSGIITSLKGLGDDSTRIQIDAAINPGNSGGPIVYEENGELAAVAVAGLSKDKTEAVNFGIKASSVENFLQSNQIDLTLVQQKFNFSNDDLAELLESSTLYTFCK